MYPSGISQAGSAVGSPNNTEVTMHSHGLIEFLTDSFRRDQAFKIKCQQSTQAWLERKIYSRVFSNYAPPIATKDLRQARKLFFDDWASGSVSMLRQVRHVNPEQKDSPEFRNSQDVERVRIFVKDIADQACKDLLEPEGFIKQELVDLLEWDKFNNTIRSAAIIEEILISYTEAMMGGLVAKVQEKALQTVAAKDENLLMYLGSCISRIADESVRALIKDSVQAAKEFSQANPLPSASDVDASSLQSELSELRLQFRRAKEVYTDIIDQLSLVAEELLVVNPAFKFMGNQQEHEDFVAVDLVSSAVEKSFSEQIIETRQQLVRLNQFIGNATLKLAESHDNLSKINQVIAQLNSILEAIAAWKKILWVNSQTAKHYPGDPEKAKYIKALIKTRDIANIIDELSEFIRKGKINNNLITSPISPEFKSITTIRSIVIVACGLVADKRIANKTTDEIARKLRQHFGIDENLLSPRVLVSSHPLPQAR
jgi:hypothetical protein